MKEEYNDFSWMNYPKTLNYIAIIGIWYGACTFLYAINRLWLYWPGGATIYMYAAMTFAILCICKVILEFRRSFPEIIIWLAMAFMTIAQLFKTLHWPGGSAMMLWGLPALLAIGVAVYYLFHMPEQYQKSRRAFAYWAISTQLTFIVLWYVQIYYLNYVVDQFEPAIPYAENSLHYMQIRVWELKYFVMGNGIAMLLPSIYLYFVTRKQQ